MWALADLVNGTVGGKPTGLHRYVGEQRFAFALLNVTDGAGDVVSLDLESRGYDGAYVTRNPFIEGCASGTTSEAGRFGGAVRLSGSGSYVKTCPWFLLLDPKLWLNGIGQTMTVAFWIRPDQDYGSGSGWAWSFGRKDLWRVGYDRSLPGLRFTVNDTTYGWRSTSAPLHLYTGRWYHVAAVLWNGGGSSSLTLYVNGDAPGYQPFASATSAHGGNAQLYLGYDEASAGAFKGTVDEFNLYSVSLPANSVRAMLSFSGGMNSVLIPRGVLYDSLLFKKMTNTSSDFMTTGPLAGGVVQSNANNGSAHLNSAVIQMTIVKNITLADAYVLLTQLWTNKTGKTTAFAFPATGEFYTLGFAWEVTKLVGNTSVANGANYSTPTWVPPTLPPPTSSWWDAAWNALAGAVTAVWNAAVAVAVFVCRAAKALFDLAVNVTVKLIAASWDALEKNVIGPIKTALEALLKFIFDMISAAVNILLRPLLDAFNQWRADTNSRFARVLKVARDGTLGPSRNDYSIQESSRALLSQEVSGWVDMILFFESIIFLIVSGLAILEILSKVIPGTQVVDIVLPILLGAIAGTAIAAVVSTVVGAFVGNPLDLLPIDWRTASDWVFTTAALMVLIFEHVSLRKKTNFLLEFGHIGPNVVGTIEGLKNVFWSFLVLSLASAFPIALSSLFGLPTNGQTAYEGMAAIDFIGLMIGLIGFSQVKLDREVGEVLKMTNAVGMVSGVIAIVSASTALAVDTVGLAAAKAQARP